MIRKRIYAIWKKQVKDTFKNRAVLIQFMMFPILTFIMQSSVKMEGIPERYFVVLFATMYIGMAPLISMASIISEEKEKNTLRVLLMSNVKAYEYLWGIGLYIFECCILGSVLFCIVGKYTGIEGLYFMLTMAIGIIVSILIGAVIGIRSNNQMAATSITVPVMMLFSFLPMLSMFNKNIEVVSRITYSQQINYLVNAIGNTTIQIENIVIIGCNMLVFGALFGFTYRKCGLA